MNFLTKELLYQKSSQELTSYLYEAAITQLKDAIQLIERKQFLEANKRMQKVNDIMRRLGAGLNYDSGIIADQLDAVYNYIAQKTIEANIKKDAQGAKDMLAILEELSAAWTEILKTKPAAVKSTGKIGTSQYEKHIMVQERNLNPMEAGN
ncbi:flagellar export chaperone FliS [Jeotgalibacillus proteolyticus]|uniref:flagellar export chaperone FliS n=1 Tax=Jeotgalibacillus proteolyticus TaxID=2082395 RepID=UPI003CFAAFB7